MFTRSKIVFAALSLCTPSSNAASMSFSHNDWELACDNTRTCRAAGYSSNEYGDKSISVLLTRKAGAAQPVTGQLMLGHYGENDAVIRLPKKFKLTMRINGNSVGQVNLQRDSLETDLTTKQVAALLAALPKAGDVDIEWSIGDIVWRLSDKGAAAVLLKMDEAQGRVGTHGALIKRGPRDDRSALPPLPLPVVLAAKVAEPLPGDAQFAGKHAKALRKALRATLKVDDVCYKLTEPEAGEPEVSVSRLSDSKFLVSTPCWSGAYNFGNGYWVINGGPPFHPVLVTMYGTDYGGGDVYSGQKGRGLGDCWSFDTWTWNGNDFVHTKSSSTGMCRLLAAGGGWELPTLLTDVRPAER